MSKYDALWDYVSKSGSEKLKLGFDDVENIAGVPIDHSFLNYRKELIRFGYKVVKISMKEKTVAFEREDRT